MPAPEAKTTDNTNGPIINVPAKSDEAHLPGQVLNTFDATNAKLKDSIQHLHPIVTLLRQQIMHSSRLMAELRDTLKLKNLNSLDTETKKWQSIDFQILNLLLTGLICAGIYYVSFKKKKGFISKVRKNEKIYCKVTGFDENFVTALAVLDHNEENERIQERLFETAIIQDILSYEDIKNGAIFRVEVIDSVASKSFFFSKYGKKSQDIFGESLVDGTETLHRLNQLFNKHEDQGDL